MLDIERVLLRVFYRLPRITINHESRIMDVEGDADVIYNRNPVLLIRLIRIAVESGLYLSEKTMAGIRANLKNLDSVPVRLIRDEFIKIITSESFKDGLNMLKESEVILYMIPESENIDKVTTATDSRIPDLWQHTLGVIENTKPTLEDRLAGLLHDMGKIKTMDISDECVTFINHAQVSEEIASVFLTRFNFKKDIIDKVCFACRYHMSYHWSKINDKEFSKRIDKFGYENIALISNLLMADTDGAWRRRKIAKTMPVIESKIKENYINPVRKILIFVKDVIAEQYQVFVNDIDINTMYF